MSQPIHRHALECGLVQCMLIMKPRTDQLLVCTSEALTCQIMSSMPSCKKFFSFSRFSAVESFLIPWPQSDSQSCVGGICSCTESKSHFLLPLGISSYVNPVPFHDITIRWGTRPVGFNQEGWPLIKSAPRILSNTGPHKFLNAYGA
ncbi:hypothetical protein PAXRUDRAFT_498114 [Paxillus rubicundulus Ve08.2h10]|uniref:Uncharacterized protein n=1 Tax=Paxillus rubicundulus Ve08.2h10 TaxID=930991 RepID=A0A0D0DLP3_9AGAM|nr:hypothetical protein PAXRUDRAFT_498114 [Paxillus rubicundulus Ve08.2h10]